MKLVHIAIILGICSVSWFFFSLGQTIFPALPEGTMENRLEKNDIQPKVTFCSLNPDFPITVMEYCELIQSYAAANDLPAALIASVIWLESSGDVSAFSNSGAVGLMQVMPRDGIAADYMCINGPCFSDRPDTQQLLNPEYNISYGTGLLVGLIRQTGDIREGLKLYGPFNVGYSYADKVMKLMEQHQ